MRFRRERVCTAPEGAELLVFEGMMDYLSAKTYYYTGLKQTALILNTVNMKERAVEAIRQAGV